MKTTPEQIFRFIVVSKEFTTSTNWKDVVTDTLTCRLHADILTAAKENGEIEIYVPRPSFFDWLFRRSRTIKQGYTIRQLMKVEHIPETLPIIEIHT